MTPDQRASTCRTCADETGTTRYCAPARCYCAHDDCPSEQAPLPPLVDAAPKTTNRTSASSWDTREESTWIDQL